LREKRGSQKSGPCAVSLSLTGDRSFTFKKKERRSASNSRKKKTRERKEYTAAEGGLARLSFIGRDQRKENAEQVDREKKRVGEKPRGDQVPLHFLQSARGVENAERDIRRKRTSSAVGKANFNQLKKNYAKVQCRKKKKRKSSPWRRERRPRGPGALSGISVGSQFVDGGRTTGKKGCLRRSEEE